MKTVDPDRLIDQIIIGKVLHRFRKNAGISQVEFCSATQISQSTLSRIEHGKSVPDVVLYWRMCTALKITPVDFGSMVDFSILNVVIQIHKTIDETPENFWTQALSLLGEPGLRAHAEAGVISAFMGLTPPVAS